MSNTGDRVVVLNPDGTYSVLKDDDAVIRWVDLVRGEMRWVGADLGGDILVLGSPAQRKIPDGHTREQAAEHLNSKQRHSSEKIGVGHLL